MLYCHQTLGFLKKETTRIRFNNISMWCYSYIWYFKCITIKCSTVIRHWAAKIPHRFFPSKTIFTKHSEAMLLLLIIFVICVSCLSCFLVCSLQPCVHLLGMGWPLGSLVCEVFVCYSHFLMWCSGPGMVLNYIDPWSLPSYSLCTNYINQATYILTLMRFGRKRTIANFFSLSVK